MHFLLPLFMLTSQLLQPAGLFVRHYPNSRQRWIVAMSTPKRVLVPIGMGSEEMEAVITIDVLRRSGADVTVASVEDSLQVTCSRKVNLVADKVRRLLSELASQTDPGRTQCTGTPATTYEVSLGVPILSVTAIHDAMHTAAPLGHPGCLSCFPLRSSSASVLRKSMT